MKSKQVVGLLLIVLGASIIFLGARNANQKMVNAGIGGVFLGVVVLAFSTSECVKVDAFRAAVEPYVELTKRMCRILELEKTSVYIPPYPNLPDGGIFVPLHKDFDLNLAGFDDNTLFVDSGRERDMGLLLIPPGKKLLEMYESYSEVESEGMGLNVVENASAVLKSLGIVESVEVLSWSEGLSEGKGEGERGVEGREGGEKEIKVRVKGVKVDFCSQDCKQAPCPICSSIIMIIAKSLGEVLLVSEMKVENDKVDITLRRMGGVDKWM